MFRAVATVIVIAGLIECHLVQSGYESRNRIYSKSNSFLDLMCCFREFGEMVSELKGLILGVMEFQLLAIEFLRLLEP